MEKQVLSKRIDYIDYLRGWAVIFMIFWHSIDALLADIYKNSFYFDIAQFLGGLVAPSFLFTAGASFSIILMKRKDELVKFGKPAKKQLKRLGIIFIIAYFLHFPFNILYSFPPEMTYVQYLNFIKTDVLHSIVLGLIFMQILVMIVQNDGIYKYVLGILSLVIVLVTPWIYEIEFAKFLPVEIATFFNRKIYSLFPIFPWLAYIFTGCIIMSILLEMNKKGKEKEILKIFLIIGIVFIIFGAVPEFLNIKTTEYYNFWLTSPNIFLIKTGCILILINLLKFFSGKANYKMKIFGIFGMESLFAYVAHLLLVYGKDSPITLEHYLGHSLNWLEYFITYFMLLFLMLLFTKLWTKRSAIFKRKNA